jgi:hypothetical protein
MKNIKYLALLVFSITLLVSCGQDDADSVTNPGNLNPTSEINLGFTDDNDGQLVLESADDNATTFTISLSTNPLPVATVITLGASSSDGTTDGTSYPETVTIPAGDTSVDVIVSFSDDGVAEGQGVETVTIEILDADFGGNFDYYLTPGDLTRTIDVTDTLPLVVETTVGDVDFSFFWAGDSDLDCRIRDAFLTTIDSGYSVTPGEFVTLPGSVPDGVYTFSIRPWDVYSSAIDYLIEMEVPTNEVYPFTSTLFNATGGWSQEITSLEITKSTNGALVTYTIVQF